ncbi:DUF6417 family protein [Streptomyces pseudovenezuelae]|uniref:Uncharacterized protein n=1 Tax=Streptomyces pseudovenezuelae TaxID=67350 RepID=A0ABT6LXG3_9ACTN|nr:DUF6417 family protein [Streptomyces pseudovenezuelae]MDH6220998.1 hypothetical protein [Streptomyces pseudovenezuelae]
MPEGLAEWADPETRAELSAPLARPVRRAARLTPHGQDTPAYALALPEPDLDLPAPGKRQVDRQPAQMQALRHFTALAHQLTTPPTEGLTERVRTATFSQTDNRWLLLTEEHRPCPNTGVPTAVGLSTTPTP